ncbi:glycosyltransferase family 4 protein [Aquihabitans sp. G128]|uniref:glycosyltransferase family 4 protein n=1 Tax=Aquihabitans sp. G128 TaxID=2849779 RepID=UPI001C23529E|nr:glycosyltransferase family 4 protein [Aquihabitans sp. G128]QXC60514.1 glycosyltransferase family 4 protein [Aquihabitans sp. G128]
MVHLVDLKADMGGSLIHTCEVLSRLSRRVSVTVITDRGSLDVLRDRLTLREMCVRVLPWPLRGRLARLVAEQLVLGPISWTCRSAVVWSPISITAPRLVRRRSYAVSFHDLHTGTTGARDRVRRRAARSARRAAVIVVPSSVVATRASDLGPWGRIVVVGGGTTAAQIDDRPSEGSAPYALCVASDQDNKGHRTLAAAVGYLAEELPEFRLVLAGSRRNGAHLASVYSCIPPAMWTDVGFVDRAALSTLLRSCRLMASASDYEGLGLALLDAISENIPLVATRVGALIDHPDLLQSAVAPGDVDALADALRLAWTHRGGDLPGAAGLAEAGLTWEATTDRVAHALGVSSR